MKTKGLVIGALIAAHYAVLTYVSAAFGLAYGAVQFRLGEILTILPLFSPSAIYGLTVGCIISNIGSSLGPVDMLFGQSVPARNKPQDLSLGLKYGFAVRFCPPPCPFRRTAT